MINNTQLNISIDTMHQCVDVLYACNKTMRMLSDKLDKGANAPECNGGKSSLQQDVTLHTITGNQAWHQLTAFTIKSMS